ncbi:MAG: phosphatase PAP2 family protein [Alysiella sp.]|uniref:phosphatase PAP2 family protein n=1 Tax=Alysiella sp. TaxID=1872483 RepID=UPI0026DD4C69|nr:phosphatase PAP2 family protein [Alysiella sp.]MDO4434510.1 phosphatase PAP2 family protein [Alysiella sp.]
MLHNKTQIYLAICALFMLCIPLMFWQTGYQWELHENIKLMHETELYALITLTYTASFPYAITTSLILTVLLCFVCRHKYQWQVIALLCILSLGITQFAKSSIKQMIQAPRPYVVAMQDKGIITFFGYEHDAFYTLPKNTQHTLITEFLKAESLNDTSRFKAIQTNLQSELGYAFPSGHSIFATSWLLLFAGLLGKWGRRTLLPLITLWAAIMLYSRVRLGMHYPIDLLVSILLSWIWHAFSFAQILPRLQQRFQAA